MVGNDWLNDITNCINQIDKEIFTLKDMYEFEDDLSKAYPNNHHIKDKIRQMLQVLRDKQVLEFVSPGIYKKIINK